MGTQANHCKMLLEDNGPKAACMLDAVITVTEVNAGKYGLILNQQFKVYPKQTVPLQGLTVI